MWIWQIVGWGCEYPLEKGALCLGVSINETRNKPLVKLIWWGMTSIQLTQLLVLIGARWSIDNWNSQIIQKPLFNQYLQTSCPSNQLLEDLTNRKNGLNWISPPQRFPRWCLFIDEFRIRAKNWLYSRLNYRQSSKIKKERIFIPIVCL